MYSEHKNIQILVSLLKQYNISNIVVSPGSRHVGFVHSVEEDAFFTTYSVVDERSAAFFALGLIQKTGRPAVVCCTSGTAACNYVSAMTEAFYRNLPLIVVSANHEERYLKKREDQLIPQTKLYEGICKKIVSLPVVKNEDDFAYCTLLVNEALIATEHHGKGPVHIDFMIDVFGVNTVEQLPNVRKIDLCEKAETHKLEQLVQKMVGKKVLILYGHYMPLQPEDKNVLEEFGERLDCVIATEKESNLYLECGVETFNVVSTMDGKMWETLKPDIVITIHGTHYNYIIKQKLKRKKDFEHWDIAEDGELVDVFDRLTNVLEMSSIDFFKNCVALLEQKSISCKKEYLKRWKAAAGKCYLSNKEYSSIYVIEKFLKDIPVGSELHVGNGVVSSYIQPFEMDESVCVYRNEATTGIDGCMSTFVGQSQLCGGLSFLLIGDLSFFYDMNVLSTRYIQNNMRILVLNNSGGETMYHAMSVKKMTEKEMDGYVGARHENSVRGWSVDRGFHYLGVHNQEELANGLREFLAPEAQGPILMEVFTNKTDNIKAWTGLFREAALDIRYEFVKPGGKYLVYGAGQLAQEVLAEIEKRNGEVFCFSDSKEEKWNTDYLGKRIISPGTICNVLDQIDKIVIGTVYVEEVKKVLQQLLPDSEKVVAIN